MTVQVITIKVLFSGSDICFTIFVRVGEKGRSKDPTATAVLTIDKVSAKDFQTTFTCVGTVLYNKITKNITLIQRSE